MTQHKLVAVLLNYNGFNLTRECILSISEFEPDPPFIVLLDNNSEDSYKLDDLHNDYPLLHIIRNDENIGFGRANNVGINWAIENIDFEYLILLNNDTLITDNALTRLTKNFDKPEIGIVTSRIMYKHDPNLVWYGGGDINYKRGWPTITDIVQNPTKEGALKSRYVEFASGCVMMFTKESISKLKGFDNRFFMYVEDLELCMRCLNQGMKIWYDADVVILHTVEGSFQGAEKFKGLHPKNPHASFQLFERKRNQWIAFNMQLTGWKLAQFSFYFTVKFYWDFVRLFLRSDNRLELIKDHFIFVKFILFPSLRK